ncbi:MAG: hypothetical protein ACD_45C00574G0003 [uncultured bacterium]|nr:MAG: hypothetical protein ACD_45C00574G0003 [uncultured bacterium]
MLQSIRDHTQGWIAGIIVSLLILSFALWGIHSYLGNDGDSSIVAKINGIEITRNQLAVAYERLQRQLQMQGALPEQAETNLKERALKMLINIQILKQASLNADYRITSEQIDSFLQSMPEFQVNGEFSLARFQQALAATLFTASDFVDLIKTSLLIDQPRLGILLTSYALPSEINNTIALVGQERHIQYLLIPQTYVAAHSVVIPEADIQAYYAQHQDEFKTPEQVSIEYVVLSVKDLAEKLHPDEEMLKKFYNENANSFIIPAQWQLDEAVLPLPANATPQDIKQAQNKMNEIVKALNQGATFTAVVKQYALDKGDEKLQKWSTINQVPVEMQKTVADLTKTGQVSAPIMTNRGISLVNVVDYKEAQVQSFSTVKDKVKEAWVRQRAEEEFGDKREKLANLTYEHPDTLQVVAKELGLPTKTTELFTKEKGVNDVSSNLKVREAAFSNDVLTLQNNSDVIQVNPESAVVLRIRSHVSAALLPLNAVHKQIANKLTAIAIEKKLAELTGEILSKLQAQALTLDQAAAKYHFQWNKVGRIGRHTTKVDQAILNTAFEMPKPQSDHMLSYASTKTTHGYAIVALSAVNEGNANVPKEEYQAYAEQVQSSLGMLEYNLYKDSLMRSSKIVIEN